MKLQRTRSWFQCASLHLDLSLTPLAVSHLRLSRCCTQQVTVDCVLSGQRISSGFFSLRHHRHGNHHHHHIIVVITTSSSSCSSHHFYLYQIIDDLSSPSSSPRSSSSPRYRKTPSIPPTQQPLSLMRSLWDPILILLPIDFNCSSVCCL